MIVLSTTAPTLAGALEQVASQASWIDGAELRVDLLAPEEQSGLVGFPAAIRDEIQKPLALICTVRRACDGGRWVAEEGARLGLLQRAVEAGYGFIDLESDLPSTSDQLALRAHHAGLRVIRSLHDFSGVPDDLAVCARSLPRGPHEIAKVAVTPRSTADLVRLVGAARELGDQPRILLGMGEYGFPTRVLPGVLGNYLTFASAPGEAAAPGHVSPEELVTRYRLPGQTSATRVFAVIGNPIAHSKSPHYHNRRFAEDGIDACYVPVLVDEVDAFFALCEALPVSGFSVTIPHKVAVMPYLTELGEDVRAAEACNTVVRSASGWRGINTDVIGFLAPLDEVLSRPLAGCPVLVIGAGGAARGIVYALLSRGADVYLWNRTTARAEALAEDLGRLTGSSVDVLSGDGRTAPDELPPVEVVVNTTSVGMHGDGDPAPWYEFAGHEIVYDVVYTPPETPLLARATGAGCRVITGDRMFAAQAAAQYELYRVLATGGAPDA